MLEHVGRRVGHPWNFHPWIIDAARSSQESGTLWPTSSTPLTRAPWNVEKLKWPTARTAPEKPHWPTSTTSRRTASAPSRTNFRRRSTLRARLACRACGAWKARRPGRVSCNFSNYIRAANKRARVGAWCRSAALAHCLLVWLFTMLNVKQTLLLF